MSARLQIGTLAFDVAEATLEATLADPHLARRNGIDPASLPLLWLLRVVAAERAVGRETWAPALEVIDLMPRIDRWTRLDGWTARWKLPDADPAAPAPQATLALQLHESLRDNVLRVGARRGTSFAFGWRALTDLYGEPPLAGTVPVVVSGELRFTGITVDTSERETDAEVRTRLAGRIRLDALRALPRDVADHRYEDGVRMARVRFVPSETPQEPHP